MAATINGTSLSNGLRSPTVGAYALVPAGSLSGSVTLDGTALTLPTGMPVGPIILTILFFILLRRIALTREAARPSALR